MLLDIILPPYEHSSERKGFLFEKVSQIKIYRMLIEHDELQ